MKRRSFIALLAGIPLLGSLSFRRPTLTDGRSSQRFYRTYDGEKYTELTREEVEAILPQFRPDIDVRPVNVYPK